MTFCNNSDYGFRISAHTQLGTIVSAAWHCGRAPATRTFMRFHGPLIRASLLIDEVMVFTDIYSMSLNISGNNTDLFDD